MNFTVCHLKRRTLSHIIICFHTLIFNVRVFLSPGSVAMSFLEIGGLFGSITSGYITDKLVLKVGH